MLKERSDAGMQGMEGRMGESRVAGAGEVE